MTPVARRAPRPRNATAVESNPKVAADAQSATIPTNDNQHDPLVPLQRTERGKRFPCGDGSLGCRPDFRLDDVVEHERQERDRAERGHRRGQQPSGESDLDTEPLRDLAAERVGHHRRQPQRGRDAEARDAGIHQKGAEAFAIGAIDPRAGRLRHRERQRIEDARPRRVAGKGRCDHGIEQEDRVGQSQRRAAEPADHPVASARAEPALDHRAGDEKCDDDEQDGAVGEAGIRVGRLEQAGEHGRRESQHRRRENRQRTGHHRENRRGEDRKETPRLESQVSGRRTPPQHRKEDRGRDPRGDRRAAAGIGHRRACPVIATGSSTSLICCSVRMCFSRTSSMMPRPVFMASAASSVDRS